ncbi:MAG: hypothetical protein WC462_03095 [archaeon]
MVQNVPGFLVVPKKTNSLERIEFDIWITRGNTANPFFFTNPSARKAIEKFPRHGSLRSTHLGALSYLLNSDEAIQRLMGKEAVERMKEWRIENKLGDKPAYCYEFFPYHSRYEEDEFKGTNRKFFENKGIALNAERIALREILKVSPKAVLVPSLWMTELREDQLKRRGMKITSSKQILSARQILRAINHHIKEYRIKNRPRSSAERFAIALKARKRIRH